MFSTSWLNAQPAQVLLPSVLRPQLSGIICLNMFSLRTPRASQVAYPYREGYVTKWRPTRGVDKDTKSAVVLRG